MSALVIVDVQHDFLPGGALAVSNGTDVISPIAQLLREHEWPVVVASKDWHPPGHISFASRHAGQEPYTGHDLDAQNKQVTVWPDHCIQGSHGGAIHPDLQKLLDSDELKERVHMVEKGTESNTEALSAFETSTRPRNLPAAPSSGSPSSLLSQHLQQYNVKKVFVTGLDTDFCVRATALGAVQDGFETFVVDEACRGVSGDNGKTWEELRGHGVQVLKMEDVGGSL